MLLRGVGGGLVAGLVLLLVAANLMARDEPAALSAQALIEGGPFFVGQEIPVQVATVGGGERPEITPPEIPGATLVPAGTGLRPIATSAIGEFALNESNAFLYLFDLIPERPGRLRVPSFVVADGARRGRTALLEVEVRPVPLEGRPASFTGGVGPMAVRVEAQPEAVRVGQAFVYLVQLEGPGSRGAASLPGEILDRLQALPIEPEVAPLPSESSVAPPRRSFRVEVRPTQAGEVTLPPVRISWFDPRTRQFSTVATSAPRVRVVDVPGLEPSRVDYGPDTMLTQDSARPAARFRDRLTTGRFWATWWLPPAGLLLIWAAIVRANRADPSRHARRVARRLTRLPPGNPATPRMILDGLARFLELAGVPSTSALTPDEVRDALTNSDADVDLADRARRLVMRCDRALYARQAVGDADVESMAAEGRSIFRSLARVRVRPGV